jgi:uncharacterized membrane protein
MAAPGTPNAVVMPSFSITNTAAIAAFIFAMLVSSHFVWVNHRQNRPDWECQQIYI